jgi:hypothetical protein
VHQLGIGFCQRCGQRRDRRVRDGEKNERARRQLVRLCVATGQQRGVEGLGEGAAETAPTEDDESF